jgi:DNA replication protein DnaC
MARADRDPLHERAHALGLHGLCTRWNELGDAPWVPELVEIEESERRRRSLERRLRTAKIGAVRPIADFDWKHPTKIPRGQVEELFDLRFLDASTPQNVILLGPNGIGKTMIAKNLAHHAVTRGYQVRFTEAAAMLGDLASQDGPAALRRRLHRYIKPALLVIDEIGYLTYNDRSADLLFQVVNARYTQASTIVTTNRSFSDWSAIFPNATCVVTLVDRLCHHAEIIAIEGESYRLKESRERSASRKKTRTRTTSRAR